MAHQDVLFHEKHRFSSGWFSKIRPFLPPLNFITIHYAYFIVVPLVASLVFWGSSNPKFSISYVDSLFLVVSAMTEAGLNTVNLSQMTTWQQVMLWLLIIAGSSIWVSIWTILVRKHAFERRFREIVKRENERRLESRGSHQHLPLSDRFRSLGKSQSRPITSGYASVPEPGSGPGPVTHDAAGAVLPISNPVDGRPIGSKVPPSTNNAAPVSGDDDEERRRALASPHSPKSAPTARADHVVFAEDPRVNAMSTSVVASESGAPVRRQAPSSGTNPQPDELKGGAAAAVVPNSSALRRDSVVSGSDDIKRVRRGRGSAPFRDLTSEERESLGGTEYRALKLLSVLVPGYWFLWQFAGSVALGAWIALHQPGPARANAIAPWWNGVFNGVSAFNNSGMTVLDANMVPYGSSYFVLVVMGLMILAGNTAYPIFLRLVVWSGLRGLRAATYPDQLAEWKATLEYILKYPRRVYTNLFPSRQTWWLLFMLFVLNGTDWIAYEVLNFGNTALEATPAGTRVIDGLFQALAVRSGGFYVVPIPTLYIGLQVLYVIMMYISVYPVVITMRHSNVYEERSLGIYEDDNDECGGGGGYGEPSTSTSNNPLARHVSNRSTASRRQAVGSVLRRTLTTAWNGVGAVPSSAGGVPAPLLDESRFDFVSHQVRSQLSHDLWWLVLAVLVIVIIETRHFLEDPVHWSVFNVVFEVVSAYGCVGITVGVPYDAFSFSGGWYPGSKLVLCLVMLRGRHRGLPVALDRAVRLPGDDGDFVSGGGGGGGIDDEEAGVRHRQVRRSVSVVGSVRRHSTGGGGGAYV
ncbi:hypothetical protein SLS62_009554 [Diatrype stigma]|uniref:Potassium transport protein n=1 Tax=Diatrype stigma TaxID=117547 RepID=A0AAN9UD66_9PEZI